MSDRDPLTLPATITRVHLRGPRCGQVETIPATAISADECDAAYRERLTAAYMGIWGALGGALVRAGEKRGVVVRWREGGGE
jgi:hypothetical protein